MMMNKKNIFMLASIGKLWETLNKIGIEEEPGKIGDMK